MAPTNALPLVPSPAYDSAGHVVAHVRGLIERGSLRPGDRLPAERALAQQLSVSRPTIRAGLRALAAMGVVRTRHGSGSYIREGPPRLDSEPLSFLAALHGIGRDELYEARRILEVAAAGLAAERATPDHLAALAEEVASLFAATDAAQTFLVHDINFHRAVATASRNSIIASLMDMVSKLFFEQRRKTAALASDADRRAAADMHRRIYQAIRARDAETARKAMDVHLQQASAVQAQETRPGPRAVERRRT
jgi:GntR family transcriptional repressor for pyruvate dehydrogenase complex